MPSSLNGIPMKFRQYTVDECVERIGKAMEANGAKRISPPIKDNFVFQLSSRGRTAIEASGKKFDARHTKRKER